MKKIILTSVLAMAMILSAFSQKPAIELTFTAENNGQYLPLNSIFVKNLTQGGDTTLYAPDTVLVLDYTGIIDNESIRENSFYVSQNYPNPFKGKTEVNLYLPEKEYIKITVRDILGRELAHYENTLNRGNHSFAFYSGKKKYYLLTVTGKQTSKTIKMINVNSNTTNGEKCKIVYDGYEANDIAFKFQKAINDFIFNPGDELLLAGISDLGESGMFDSPSSNQTYTFEFATNIPCPGTPTVTYEGQVYNTIQIFSQCWLKENLNVGTVINGSENMSDDGTIEKYCYDNEEDSCAIYGGLYQWDEMMQYSTTPGVQGICPSDWHLPTDDEWKILEGTVDSQYPVGDPEWDDINYRGFDASLNLKATSGWNSGGNGTDEYGFTALPGGFRSTDSDFYGLFSYGYFWSSTENNLYNTWYRNLCCNFGKVLREDYGKDLGYSARCLQD